MSYKARVAAEKPHATRVFPYSLPTKMQEPEITTAAARRERNRVLSLDWKQRNKARVKAYDKAKYLKNREKNIAVALAYYHKNKVKTFAHRSAYQRNKSENIRRLLLASMGGKCTCCGYTDWRALQVDHINGGGCQESAGRNAVTWYEKLTENPEPDKYQLLCANCNATKKIMGREFGKDRSFPSNQARDRVRDRELARKRHAETRVKALTLMGGRCVQCSFSVPAALQIDHVHGGGTADRQRMNPLNFYRHVLKLEDRSALQLLCANCNTIKRHENREHRKSVLFPDLSH